MYVRPRTLDEAVQALETPGMQILAGGTDFYPARVGRTITENLLDLSLVRPVRPARHRRQGRSL